MATGLNMSVDVCLSLCVIPAPRLYDASRPMVACLCDLDKDKQRNIILKSILNKYIDCTICALLSYLSRIITFTYVKCLTTLYPTTEDKILFKFFVSSTFLIRNLQ